MKRRKRRLVTKLPDGKVVSRWSLRRFTHVVAMQLVTGVWVDIQWTAHPDDVPKRWGRECVYRLCPVVEVLEAA